MEKKTINSSETSFIQVLNISCRWCKEWENDFLSDEVLADRIAEIIKTKTGLRGFFAYSLSDMNCSLLDKLPTSLIFKFQEIGESIVEIVIKNYIMSSAQVITHQLNNDAEHKEISENIAERCSNLLKVLDTKLVSKHMNIIIKELDNMGNSMNKKVKYSRKQKEYIIYKINSLV